MCVRGFGVLQSDKEALVWYGKAAEQGHAGAQYNLGFMYDQGRRVPKNTAKAISRYQKAGAQGHQDALGCVAGLGATQSPERMGIGAASPCGGGEGGG